MLDGISNLVTPDNFAEVLTKALGAIGAAVTGLAGLTLYRARKEPSKPQTPEQFVLAYNQALAVNNEYLAAMVPAICNISRDISDLNRKTSDSVRISGEAKDLLGKIHDETIRGHR